MALGEMNSGNESACELKRLSDTRNTATKPSDYYGKFVLTGIKHCTALGLPSSGSTGYGFSEPREHHDSALGKAAPRGGQETGQPDESNRGGLIYPDDQGASGCLGSSEG